VPIIEFTYTLTTGEYPFEKYKQALTIAHHEKIMSQLFVLKDRVNKELLNKRTRQSMSSKIDNNIYMRIWNNQQSRGAEKTNTEQLIGPYKESIMSNKLTTDSPYMENTANTETISESYNITCLNVIQKWTQSMSPCCSIGILEKC